MMIARHHMNETTVTGTVLGTMATLPEHQHQHQEPPASSALAPLSRRETPYRILLGVTGSVAAVKAPELAVRLVEQLDRPVQVRVLLTAGGSNFWYKTPEYDAVHWAKLQMHIQQPQNKQENEAKVQNGNGSCHFYKIVIHEADEEWQGWHRLGDPVLHIDLRDDADLLLIAPLSAHTLAKLAHGLCDDTLSCVARAWDLGHGQRPAKPVLLAPAMNTAMWDHPLTQQQLDTMVSLGRSSSLSGAVVTILPPQAKMLACGEVGMGALASVDSIVQAVQQRILLQESEEARTTDPERWNER